MSKIYNADCIKFMQSMFDNSVDLTLTDIPYGECGKKSAGLRTLDKGIANELTFDLQTFLKEVDRVTSGTIIIFCGMEQYSEIFSYFAEKQKERLGTVRGLCWAKTNPSPMNGQYFYTSGFELAVYYKPRKCTFNARCKSNVFRYPNGKSKEHPTEKNYNLMKELIADCSNVGDLIFDPCCGSGTTLKAAEELCRNSLGVELDPCIYERTRKSLSHDFEYQDIAVI